MRMFNFISMIKNENKKQRLNMIKKLPFGMKHSSCNQIFSFISFFNLLFFSDHVKGQDILHVGVYDKDLIFDDKIGSIKIDLQELYRKGFVYFHLIYLEFVLFRTY